MPRFFTSAVQFDEAASVGSAVIDGEDGRHIARSLRMHTGDALTLSDGAGTDYTGEIESITGDTVMVRLTDKFKNRSEPTLRVTLYPGMPKADKLELITQKAEGGGEALGTLVSPDEAEVSVFIGPEGGFDAAEVQLAKQYGATPATLGPRILRTETAPLAALSVLMYITGNMQ